MGGGRAHIQRNSAISISSPTFQQMMLGGGGGGRGPHPKTFCNIYKLPNISTDDVGGGGEGGGAHIQRNSAISISSPTFQQMMLGGGGERGRGPHPKKFCNIYDLPNISTEDVGGLWPHIIDPNTLPTPIDFLDQPLKYLIMYYNSCTTTENLRIFLFISRLYLQIL